MNKPVSLVTGCSGFIGSYVAAELLQMGHHVIGIDDLSGGFLENNPKDIEFIQGSITDKELIDDIFRTNHISYVFHLASYAAEALSHFIRRFNYTNNILGSINLINAAINRGTIKCFVFTSSIAVYGKSSSPMTEEVSPHPMDPYGIAKYSIELDLQCAHTMFGLDYIVFRPHNVYGERQNIGDQYRNVVGIFMNNILMGEPMPIYGDGTQTRAFTYIGDVAPIIAHSIERQVAYNNIFNIGADIPYSVKDLASIVAHAMGKTVNIRHLDFRNEATHVFSSQDKLKKIFGDLITNVSLEEGIAHMASWVIQHGSRRSKSFEAIEVKKNLPSFQVFLKTKKDQSR